MNHQTYLLPQQALVPLTWQGSIQLSTDQTHNESSLISLKGIQNCPFEVLTEIFLDYLEDRGCQIQHLLFICGHWYRLIMHTSIFWTKITVVIPPPYIRPTAASQLRYINVFMDRSRDRLLDIEVESSGIIIMYGIDTWQNYGWVVEMLRNSMHRWRTLHITLPSDFDLSGILCGLFKGPAPNLVKLLVGNFRYRAHQLVSFSALPRLKSLEIDVYAFIYQLQSFPLAQLHSLDLDLNEFMMSVSQYSLSDWISEMSLLRSLHSLQIRFTANRSLYHKEFRPEPISLPLLRRLSLWGLGDLRLRFSLPTLRVLTFDGGYLPKIEPMEVIWRPDRKISHGSIDRDLLKAIMLQYPSAKMFVFPNWAEDALTGAVQMMKSEGSIPDSSVSFIKESSDGRRKPMNIDFLIS